MPDKRKKDLLPYFPPASELFTGIFSWLNMKSEIYEQKVKQEVTLSIEVVKALHYMQINHETYKPSNFSASWIAATGIQEVTSLCQSINKHDPR